MNYSNLNTTKVRLIDSLHKSKKHKIPNLKTTSPFQNWTQSSSLYTHSSFNNLIKNMSNNPIQTSNSLGNLMLKTLSDYKSDTWNLMSHYYYKSPNEPITDFENFLTKTRKGFYNSNKKEVLKILNQTKSQKLSKILHKYTHEDNKTQVNFKWSDFTSPFESLNLVTQNREIHDQVLNNHQNREVWQFEKTWNKVSILLNKKKIANKVKVTSVIPKIIEDTLFDNQSNSLIKETQQTRQSLTEWEDADYGNAKIISIPNIDFINRKLILYAKSGYCKHVFPESRELFSLVEEPKSNIIYLYGGLTSNSKSNPLWSWYTKKSNLICPSFIWNHIKPENLQPEVRSGHSCIIYKNKMIWYGGKYVNIPLMADLDIYNIETNTWSNQVLSTINYLKLRRNHIACLIGQHMFVHGGISETGEYWNDSHWLCLSPLKWSPSFFSYFTEMPTLAMHSCALVVPGDVVKSNKLNIYKYPELSMNRRWYSRIKEKGIYVFGGKSKDDDKPNNTWRVILIGKKPWEWITLETKGKPPCGRYLCSMNYFEEGNILIIHGGRNDFHNRSSSSFALKDTYVFELFRWEWWRVEFSDSDINNNWCARCGHGAVISGRNLIIFGGMNGSHYLPSSLFIINLDPEIAKEHLKKKQWGWLPNGMSDLNSNDSNNMNNQSVNINEDNKYNLKDVHSNNSNLKISKK